MCRVLECPTKEGHGTIRASPEEGHKVEHLLYEDRLRNLGLLGVPKREPREERVV